MKLFSRPSKTLPRAASLAARPKQQPLAARAELPDGGVSLTIQFPRPSWQKRLGGSEQLERAFQLDYLGREVYEACDGASDVQTIISRFAAAHKISQAEAEISVTTFLRTLISRGLIVMVVDAGPVAPPQQ